MRLSFFSNYLNAHTLPLCLAFANSPGIDFTFVAQFKWGGNVGRKNQSNDYDFVIRSYDGDSAWQLATRHALEDDVVIFGHMESEEWVQARMQKGLLTFRNAERLLKRGLLWRFAPPKAWRTYNRFVRYRKQPFYVLCSSAYTAYDLMLAGFPLEKCLTWGYFVDAPKKQTIRSMPSEFPVSLLWAARMVDWKQPLSAAKAAKFLFQRGIPFSMTMYGDGAERQMVADFVNSSDLSDWVSLPGTASQEKMPGIMRSNDIFLFTSNRKEGWGAALGEAMAQGCAVVANAAAGASPFLVSHGKNGLLYDGSQSGLNQAVELLCCDADLRRRLGAAALETIQTTWNAENAAVSFLQMAEAMLDGAPNPISEGPSSPARLYKDGWFS